MVTLCKRKNESTKAIVFLGLSLIDFKIFLHKGEIFKASLPKSSSLSDIY